MANEDFPDDDISNENEDDDGEIEDEPGCLQQLVSIVILLGVLVLVINGCGACNTQPTQIPALAPPPAQQALPVADRGANGELARLETEADEADLEAPAVLPAVIDRPKAVEVPPDIEPPSSAELAKRRIDAAKWRTWKSDNGKFTLYAKFVTVINGRMTLEKEDGSRTNVALERLCEDDIKFVRRQEWKKASKPGIR